MAVVSVEGLSAGYGDKVVLEGMRLSLESGVHVLLGPNGCGKTTFLHALCGLLKPLSGRVLIDGSDVHSLSPRQRAKAIAIVEQEHHPFFSFIARDIVQFGRMPHRRIFALPTAEDAARAEAALRGVGAEDFADRPYTELSGGERKLVLIAMALCQDAEVLVLDEPTAFLDINHAMRISRLIGQLDDGKRVIIVSLHDLNRALCMEGKALMFFPGREYLHAPIREAIVPENLERLYGTRFEVGRSPDDRLYALPIG